MTAPTRATTRSKAKGRAPARPRARPKRGMSPPGPLWDAVHELGFRPRGSRAAAADAVDAPRAGTHTHRSSGVSLHAAREWVMLSVDAGASDPLGGSPADPGLWRLVADSSGAPARTFEVTPALLGPGRPDASSWRSVLEWALATADGEAPSGWDSPDPQDVASWIPREALTVRVGAELRQGRVIHDERRLAIEFPWVSPVPPDLPATRRVWLERVLLDAQRTWRLARVCRAEDASVVGSVDLTGAPPDRLPTISRAALDTLRWVTSWVVPPTALLTDLSLESRLLDAAPSTARPSADVHKRRGAECTTTTGT